MKPPMTATSQLEWHLSSHASMICLIWIGLGTLLRGLQVELNLHSQNRRSPGTMSTDENLFETISEVKAFGGQLTRYKHYSKVNNCVMTFAIFHPKISRNSLTPVLWFLSGLTCTDENVCQKSGVFRDLAEAGIALIAPDTSPRGCNVEGESASWDFGVGAGFYVDATESKWKTNWNMYSYVTEELPALIKKHRPSLDLNNQSITGHSMGGHGALICALKNPGKFKSVSAFAPIANPMNCPWGQKAFSGYLGEDFEAWKKYDATELVKSYQGPDLHILVDQGTKDNFYFKDPKQLLPENFQEAANKAGVKAEVRLQDGYDHSYYFISTFIGEHVKHHAKYLKQ
eukprot:TRINITY_DN626_c0_g1_i2.p1 TRINITY_DN626_c0_g1~~TRINITY_DN626_c0_g1_i2.p1  ORF type:complete len:343 (-),score=67.33 TRINITY_DN626_c0_g1_i2:68-1096(-)